MSICSYLVIPEPGQAERLVERLEALPGCEVARAEGRDLLVLITDTPDRASERTLRERLDAVSEIRVMALTFGSLEATP